MNRVRRSVGALPHRKHAVWPLVGNDYKEAVEAVFENIRNLVMCALLIAAGLYEHDNASGFIGLLGVNHFLGWGLVAIGVVLTLANLAVGLSQLSKLAFPKLSMTLLFCVYVVTSVRLVVVLTAFRTGS